MNTIFVRLPFKQGYKCFVCGNDGLHHRDLRNAISYLYGLKDSDDFMLYVNGKELSGDQYVYPNENVLFSFRLPGGKGGFGSMLRAIGAQIEKTTNREACRDLSGRRLRDINEEQRLKKWISKKAEREAEKIRRRKERIERLKSRPKHNFVDFEYEKEISNLPERVDEALNAGLQKVKRPFEINEPSTSSNKKKHLWLDDDISESSSDSDLDRNSFSQQCAESSDENASCSTSLNKTKNLVLSTSDENSAQVLSDESNSTSSPSSSDVQIISQSDICHKSESQSECVEPIASSPKKSADNSSNLGTDLIEKACESNQSQTDEKNLLELDDDSPVNLDEFNSAAELEALGLQRLKSALMERGLKCGGNIKDRAQRLWTIRGLCPEKYPKNLLAKPKK